MDSSTLDALLGSPAERFQRTRDLQRVRSRLMRLCLLLGLFLILFGQWLWGAAVTHSLAALRAAADLEPTETLPATGFVAPLLGLVLVAWAFWWEDRRERALELATSSLVLRTPGKPHELRLLLDPRKRSLLVADEQGRVLGELDASAALPAWRVPEPKAGTGGVA